MRTLRLIVFPLILCVLYACPPRRVVPGCIPEPFGKEG